jgi:K+-transporting ATPase KdpF subunit
MLLFAHLDTFFTSPLPFFDAILTPPCFTLTSIAASHAGHDKVWRGPAYNRAVRRCAAYTAADDGGAPRKGDDMEWELLLAGVVAVLLLVYLLFTMLFPEKF